jgi:hypothetical protein
MRDFNYVMRSDISSCSGPSRTPPTSISPSGALDFRIAEAADAAALVVAVAAPLPAPTTG